MVHKSLIFGLFRAFPALSGLIAPFPGYGRDDDGGDESRVADGFGVAFGQDADGGQAVLLKLVGQVAEPPAEHHHVSGGKRERQFLRWLVFVVLRIRVWLRRGFDQLAGVEGPTTLFRLVELDAGYPYCQPRIGRETGSGYADRHVNSAWPWPPSQRWASVRRPG